MESTALERATSRPLTPVWLSHHLECEQDRCVRVGAIPVCRRCLAISLGLIPAWIVLATTDFALQGADVAAVGGLSVAAAVDFVQVARRAQPYRARRVLISSPAVGGVLAYLGHDGFTNGLGMLHAVGAVLAAALLVVLVRNGDRVGVG